MPDAALPPATEGPKPGVRTTEFWVTVITGLVSLAVAVCSTAGLTFDPGPWEAVVPAASLIAATIAAAAYSNSRAKVKSSTEP